MSTSGERGLALLLCAYLHLRMSARNSTCAGLAHVLVSEPGTPVILRTAWATALPGFSYVQNARQCALPILAFLAGSDVCITPRGCA